MSIINRNNYEIYFLDYLEGNLNPELRKEMELFLINNPDLKEELDGLEDAVLPVDKIIFQAKQSLKNFSLPKRPPRFLSDDEFLIAKIEGDLTPEEETVFELYLRDNLEIEKEYAFFNNTKLQADKSIVFENKSLLYRQEKTPAPVLTTTRPVRFVTDDEFMVAKIEGDLTSEEEYVFELYIKGNPAIEKEYSLYKLTILESDQSVVFEHKSSLKRLAITPKYHLLRKYSLAVASVAAVLLFVTFFFFDKEESPLTPDNSNYLSLIHRSSENQENVMSENKLSFNGVPEKNSNENKDIKNDIKVQNNLHANLDNSNMIKTDKEEPLNKTDLSQNNKVVIIENLKPDIQQNNKTQVQPDNNKVQDISKPIVNTNNVKQNQIKSTPNPKKNVKSEKGNLTFWDLAVMGVRGLGNLFDKKIELKQQYDANGNVKSLAFNSPNLEFSAPVKKK